MSDAKQEIVQQFEKHGRTVNAVHDIALKTDSPAWGTLVAFTGGRLSADRLVVVAASGPFGPECIVQAFDGKAVLPAEYHLAIPGALRSPVEFLRRRGGSWNAGDDGELEKWLKSQKFETYLLPDELKQGLTKVKLEHLIQLTPVNAHQSQLVFTVGGIHSIINLDPYVSLVTKLAACLGASVGSGAVAPLGDVRYGELVAAAHAGQLAQFDGPTNAPPAAGDGMTGAPAIDPAQRMIGLRAALQEHVGNRVLLAPIDAKPLGNILKKVAKGVPGDQIMAFLDTGLRASGKAGWAFAPDAVHISEIGENWTIAYDDIRSFRRTKSKVILDSRLTGEITCDVMNVDEVVIPALEAVTGRPATN